MKIIRYQDKQGVVGYAAQQPDGQAFKITGDIYASPSVTGGPAEVAQLLAPIALDPLTVADDRNFLEEIAAQPNVPEDVRSRLAALY